MDDLDQIEDDPDKVDESNDNLIQKSQLEVPAEVKPKINKTAAPAEAKPKFNLAASLQMIKKARAQGKFQ